jgi:hypothetical protein
VLSLTLLVALGGPAGDLATTAVPQAGRSGAWMLAKTVPGSGHLMAAEVGLKYAVAHKHLAAVYQEFMKGVRSHGH